MANRALTKKQKLFVENYLQLWKPSEAARQAGYKHGDQQGARMLKNPLIAALIDQRMREISMQTDEVLTRLTQQARVNMGDFLIEVEIFDSDNVIVEKKIRLNWDMVREYGYLIKRLSWSRNGDPILELHDSQTALVQIGRARKLFVDQVEDTHHLDQTQVNIYIPGNGREIEKQEPAEGI
jgi:phage terminase small subunit